MRNLKKVIALVLAVALTMSTFTVAFAAEATSASKLSDLGLLLNTSEEELGADLTRDIGLAMILKALGWDQDAANEKAASNPFEDVTQNWFKGYAGLAVEEGITTGKSATSFAPKDTLTQKEFVAFMLRALGYETEKAWDEAADLGAAAGLVEAGNLLDAAVFTKADAADVMFAALKAELQGEGAEGTLADALIAAGAFTEAQAIAAGVKEAEPVVTHATKVVSVSADNLVEVVVKFDGTVEKATAEEFNNYSLNNSKTITDAVLSDDGTEVTLTVNTSSPLGNQTEYELSFNSVRSTSGSIISVKEYKFTPVDAQLPHAVAVEALGNKTIKVTFNEPVTAAASSFKIDDKVVLGYTDIVGRVVTVKLYTALDNGVHKLNIKDAADYFTLKSLSQDFDFTVVEDTTAPVVAEVVKATFESVTIRFSEPVDKATVIGTNLYWLQGTTKNRADYNAIRKTDDTFEFIFSGTSKIQYATDLYLSGVKDYSGNTIAADTKIAVSPVIDTERPDVVNVIQDSLTQLTVKFTKNVETTSAQKSANYVIKDADGKEVSKVKNITAVGKIATIILAEALKEGKEYTIEISGVSDNTTLKNVMMPYSTKISVDDETAPTVNLTADVNSANNSVIITFNEKMSVSGDGSVVDPSKYLYNKGAGLKALPSGANINVTADGKSVIIVLPLSVVDVDDLTGFRVQLVKDLAGNYLSGLSQDLSMGNTINPTVFNADAVKTTEIEVEFTAALQSNTVNASDFIVQNADGSSIDVVAAKLDSDNSKIVVLTIAENTKLEEVATYKAKAVTVTIATRPTTSTASGKAIAAGSSGTVNDKISATIAETNGILGSADGTTIKLKFNEIIEADSLASPAHTDLVIKDKDGKLVTGFSVATLAGGTNDDAELVITLPSAYSGTMTVAIPNPRFITDLAGNVIAEQEALSVNVDNAVPTVANKLTAAGDINTTGTHTLVFSEDIDSDSRAAVKAIVDAAFTANGTATVSSVWTNNKTLTVTIGGTVDSGSNKVVLAALTVPANFKVKDLAGYQSATLTVSSLQN